MALCSVRDHQSARFAHASAVHQRRPLAEDLALLQQASDVLTNFGGVGKSLVCDGEPARAADLASRFPKR